MQTTQQSKSSLDILLATGPHSSEDMATLVRVASLLNSTLDLKRVLRISMEEAARLMDAEASSITVEMMLAAARTLANIVPEGELMPEMMDPATHQAVADAVADAAN